MNTGNNLQLSSEQALLELTLLNADQSQAEFDDVVISGLKRGIPPELLTRLKALWEQTRMVAGEVIAVGKILVMKIIAFLQANPKMAAGLAIGAAVTALVAAIPIVGSILAPIVAWFAMPYGAGVGAAMQKGDNSGSPFSAAIELATKFFELIAIIFNAVTKHWA